MSNLFAAEPAIIARIDAQIPALAFVGPISALEQFETVPPVPAVIVRPVGSVVTGDPHDGAFQIDVQTWEIALMVEHQQSDTTETETTVKQAGELLFQIAQALVGWRPATGYQPLAYRGRPDPYYEPGYAEFPINFETGLVITGLGN